MLRTRQFSNNQLVLVAGLITAALLSYGVMAAPKASATEYDGGRLIDDSVFRDSNGMTKSQVQTFLESMNSGLKSKAYELSCYGADSKEREWYTAAGATCDVEIPASHIIYYAAKIYGVNPKVILATLQKEQSLITTTNPTSWQLNQAMGYGCPTSGGCGSSTFSYQIDSGTWVLRFHYERANGNNTWWNNNGYTCGTTKNFYKPHLYPGTNVAFYDQDNVKYRTHYISNAATSAFYCYTPHAYNNPDGLYGLPVYGTKGRYYTGSYNFVKSFNTWFGSTWSNLPPDQALVGDWDGDGEDTIGIKRGNQYLLDNDNDSEADVTFGIGRVTDQALVGDWDGDGMDEIGLRRGNKFYLDTDNDGVTNIYFTYGRTTDTFFVGDWDGDGMDEIGIKRGNVYYLNYDYNSSADKKIAIGRVTDKVIVGNWDGDEDGKDEIGLRRGNHYYFDTDDDGKAEVSFGMGRVTDKVIIGDWDGDGKDSVGLNRGKYNYLDNNSDGVTDMYIGIGRTTDAVIVGDWDDDGADEIGLKRYNRYYYDTDSNGSAEVSFIFGYF
jgi:hypothetical protein